MPKENKKKTPKDEMFRREKIRHRFKQAAMVGGALWGGASAGWVMGGHYGNYKHAKSLKDLDHELDKGSGFSGNSWAHSFREVKKRNPDVDLRKVRAVHGTGTVNRAVRTLEKHAEPGGGVFKSAKQELSRGAFAGVGFRGMQHNKYAATFNPDNQMKTTFGLKDSFNKHFVVAPKKADPRILQHELGHVTNFQRAQTSTRGPKYRTPTGKERTGFHWRLKDSPTYREEVRAWRTAGVSGKDPLRRAALNTYRQAHYGPHREIAGAAIGAATVGAGIGGYYAIRGYRRRKAYGKYRQEHPKTAMTYNDFLDKHYNKKRVVKEEILAEAYDFLSRIHR